MNKVSGYIELTINGECYPIKFGWGAWDLISKGLGKPISSMFIGMGEHEIMAWMIYGGLNYAHRAGYDNSKSIGSHYEAFELLDEMDSEQMNKLVNVFLESKVLGQTMGDYNKASDELNEKKKKK